MKRDWDPFDFHIVKINYAEQVNVAVTLSKRIFIIIFLLVKLKFPCD